MTDKDLTSQEQVNKAIGMCRLHGLHNTEATLRALSAALETEKARAEALDAKLKEAVRVLERVEVSEFCAAPASEEGIKVRKFVRAFLASLEGDKG